MSATKQKRRPVVVIDTDYKPHSVQIDMHKSDAIYRVMVCGRQIGKTTAGLAEVFGAHPLCKRGALQVDGGKFFFVTRTYKHAKSAYTVAKSIFAPIIQRNTRGGLCCNDTDLTIRVVTGSVVEFRSADRPDNLRGFTLNGVVLDECTLLASRVWAEILQPTLATTNGWALLLGTARGRGSWVYPLFVRGQDGNDPEWESWRAPTSCSPLVSASRLATIKASIPEAYFLQEYMAEWLDDAVGYFLGVDDVYEPFAVPPGPRAGNLYYAGVDLAKNEDYTVVYVLESNPRELGVYRVVEEDRWRRVAWNQTKTRVAQTINRWGAKAVIDATEGSVGSPILDDLRIMCPRRVYGFGFHTSTKEPLLDGLSVAISNRTLRLPGTPETPRYSSLDQELRGYGWVPSRTGILRPGPRDGGTDDCVMALALAVYAAKGGLGRATRFDLLRGVPVKSEFGEHGRNFF